MGYIPLKNMFLNTNKIQSGKLHTPETPVNEEKPTRFLNKSRLISVGNLRSEGNKKSKNTCIKQQKIILAAPTTEKRTLKCSQTF